MREDSPCLLVPAEALREDGTSESSGAKFIDRWESNDLEGIWPFKKGGKEKKMKSGGTSPVPSPSEMPGAPIR